MLIGERLGLEQSKGASNALLAGLLMEKADKELKTSIAICVGEIIVDMRRAGTPLRTLQDLNKNSRLVQTNFIALACNNLEIDPPVGKCDWYNVQPYRVGSRITKNDIIGAQRWFKTFRGVQLEWPGDDVKIDLLKLSGLAV